MATPTSAELASRLVDDLIKSAGKKYVYAFKDIDGLSATGAILEADSEVHCALLRECVSRIGAMRSKLGKPGGLDTRYMNLHHQEGFPDAAVQIIVRLLRRSLPLTADDLTYLIDRTADLEM